MAARWLSIFIILAFSSPALAGKKVDFEVKSKCHPLNLVYFSIGDDFDFNNKGGNNFTQEDLDSIAIDLYVSAQLERGHLYFLRNHGFDRPTNVQMFGEHAYGNTWPIGWHISKFSYVGNKPCTMTELHLQGVSGFKIKIRASQIEFSKSTEKFVNQAHYDQEAHDKRKQYVIYSRYWEAVDKDSGNLKKSYEVQTAIERDLDHEFQQSEFANEVEFIRHLEKEYRKKNPQRKTDFYIDMEP